MAEFLTPTQFAWTVLGMGDYQPPVPRKGPRYGPDDVCWLCGGPTGGVGWRWRDAIPETFTNHTLAAAPASRTVCQACAALGSKITWEAYVALHPEMGLKTGHAMSWRYYSHLFAAPQHHECPTRGRWREILLEPPEPPFMVIIAQSGQKHIVFRGRIAGNRDVYPVQIEDRRIWLNRAEFTRCLADFEAAYNAGFSKDGIVSGRYHHGQMLKVGLARWRALEQAIAPWRTARPALLALAAHVAQRDEPPKAEQEERASCFTDSTLTTALQPSLL